LIYLEDSLDNGSQWAVFEPNNHRLRPTAQLDRDFLLMAWKDGALLGVKPEDAYFVRCDRAIMTQNDLDNGRLICLIGVVPTKPAEFVIFRIGPCRALSLWPFRSFFGWTIDEHHRAILHDSPINPGFGAIGRRLGHRRR